MEEASFQKVFQKIIDLYELAPGVAAKLLQKILAALTKGENRKDPPDPLPGTPNQERQWTAPPS